MELKITTKTNEYPIIIENSFDGLLNAFERTGLTGRKLCIISDSNVAPIYLDKVKALLEGHFLKVVSYSFEAGENSKNLDTISKFYDFFVEEQLDRRSVLVALGGGVVGDMTGFAAASYMRGIPFVQVPTTLLAQVDSSVGGKTGVDYKGNKNMVGAFYQPHFVYINTATLNTLPKREFAAGMAEAVKYGYIIDKDYLDFITQNKEQIKALDEKAIAELVYGSCKCKAYVVDKDEKESGLREILNFGHTFGHAVETLSGFKLIHGECVAIGMASGLYFSLKRGCISEDELKAAEALMLYFDLPIRVEGLEAEEIFKQMFYDKKTKDGKLNIVVLNKIGNAYTEKNATDTEVHSAIDYIIK
jgi:3-dehydroquinate synthase